SSSASSYASSISSQTRSPRRVAAAALSRKISFLCAILTASCAGSVTVFSLYGHIFQERLHYSQFQVNGLAISLGVALYLPVPVLGYLCDRVGPAPLSFMAAVLFGAGYGLAAGLYRKGLSGWSAWEYYAMIASFATIGVATCAMYLASVSTCAKNFGKGKHRGLAIAVPTAAFGLSGMWESQVGSRLLYERLPDGSKGDVDVFRFFLFLAILLTVVGLIGTAGLRIVDEEDLIDDAVEELERSGIMDGSALFSPGRALHRGYGAIERTDPFDEDDAGILNPSKDTEVEDARLKKEWVLNAETRRFLGDPTMWCFALGFFFMIGPGEAFINNLGTIIGTLYPPTLKYAGNPTSAATHVSILGITSTAARLLTGSLTDILAPSPQAQHMQMISSQELPQKRFSISRIPFLIFFALAMSLGLVALASGLIQNHGDRFWVVSTLVGAGYGAVFSLTPIIITVIWGVESFSFHWGFVAMFPALGSTMWGLIYSAVYQAGARKPVEDSAGGIPSEPDGIFCYGTQCYAATFWAMAASVWIACLLVLWAWKGKGGWSQRGIVI
ncbi:major facilitator superfamily domain-containing protein, partial [Coniochaeta sp. 2T2.1]